MQTFTDTLCDKLSTRLIAELIRLDAPESVFELLYGLSFFSLYRISPDMLEADFHTVLKSSVTALEDTGGFYD